MCHQRWKARVFINIFDTHPLQVLRFSYEDNDVDVAVDVDDDDDDGESTFLLPSSAAEFPLKVSGAFGAWVDGGPLVCGGFRADTREHSDKCFKVRC